MFMEMERNDNENVTKPTADAEIVAQDMAAEVAAEAAGDVADNDGAPSTEAEIGQSVAPLEEPEAVDNGNGFDTAGLERLIEEAENRGYLRGRNARIEELMSEPGMYRPLGVEESGGAVLQQTEILTNMRRSVWD